MPHETLVNPRSEIELNGEMGATETYVLSSMGGTPNMAITTYRDSARTGAFAIAVDGGRRGGAVLSYAAVADLHAICARYLASVPDPDAETDS